MDKKGQLSNLYTYTLAFIMIGLVVVVGVILLDKFGDQVRTDTAVTQENITNATAFANVPVRSVQSVVNSSGVAVTLYTFASDTFVTSNGAATFLVNYTYGKNTSASDVTYSTLGAVTPITSDWMPIIVIVAVLAIVLALVVGAFGQRRM